MKKLSLLVLVSMVMTLILAFSAQAETLSNKLSISPKGESDKVFKRVVTILEDAGYDVYESDKDIGKLKARKKLGSSSSFLLTYVNYALVDAKVRDRGDRSTITIVIGVHQDTVGAIDGQNIRSEDYMNTEAIETHGLTAEIAKETGTLKNSVTEEFGMDEEPTTDKKEVSVDKTTTTDKAKAASK